MHVQCIVTENPTITLYSTNWRGWCSNNSVKMDEWPSQWEIWVQQTTTIDQQIILHTEVEGAHSNEALPS